MSRPFEQILQELVESMDNPIATFVTKGDTAEISSALRNIKGLPEFLKQTMGADMRRYFAASPEEQAQIKGAFSRTAYLLSLAVPRENMDHTKNMVTGPRTRDLRM